MVARIPDCPLARTVGQIGQWWTLEILHETFDGHTSFAAIQENLGLPTEVLTERLAALVDTGILEPHGDQGGISRTEYLPTVLGCSLRPILLVMAAWGNHRLEPDQRSLILVDVTTGEEAEPVVVDRATGRRVDTTGYAFTAGPAASEALRARYRKR